jgi:4-carboxymuconolactone decarboxylase
MSSLPDTTSQLTGKAREIYESIVARRAAQGTSIRGLYIPLMNHPELAQHIERLGYFLKFEAKLPRHAYEFVVLTMAKKCGVAFEWVDHVEHARAAGLSEPVIAAIQTSDRAAIPHPYSVILRTIDVVLEFKSIPKELQEEMTHLYGVPGLIEIVTLCGFYQLVGEITQAFDVPLPDGAVKPF